MPLYLNNFYRFNLDRMYLSKINYTPDWTFQWWLEFISIILSIDLITNRHHTIQEDDRVNSLTILFCCQVQMGTCWHTCITRHSYYLTRLNISSDCNLRCRQVTIANRVVASLNCDVSARTLIMSRLHHFPRKHGKPDGLTAYSAAKPFLRI